MTCGARLKQLRMCLGNRSLGCALGLHFLLLHFLSADKKKSVAFRDKFKTQIICGLVGLLHSPHPTPSPAKGLLSAKSTWREKKDAHLAKHGLPSGPLIKWTSSGAPVALHRPSVDLILWVPRKRGSLLPYLSNERISFDAAPVSLRATLQCTAGVRPRRNGLLCLLTSNMWRTGQPHHFVLPTKLSLDPFFARASAILGSVNLSSCQPNFEDRSEIKQSCICNIHKEEKLNWVTWRPTRMEWRLGCMGTLLSFACLHCPMMARGILGNQLYIY